MREVSSESDDGLPGLVGHTWLLYHFASPVERRLYVSILYLCLFKAGAVISLLACR